MRKLLLLCMIAISLASCDTTPDFTRAFVVGVEELRNNKCLYTVKHHAVITRGRKPNAEFIYYCGLEIGQQVETAGIKR